MTTRGPSPQRLSRRQALGGVAGVGIGLPLLAACGGGTNGEAAVDPGPTASGPAAPAGPLTTTSDIEVGGGAIFAEDNVVITQPTAGEFKGFSSTCTHSQCTVSSVSDGLINCACHGSKFSIEDGSVQGGPAPSPLGEVPLKVDGAEISLV